MKPKVDKHANDTVVILKELVKTYPNQLLSTHLAMALAEFPKFEGISNKELYFIFEKYRCEKELDMDISHQEDIEEIYKDGMSLGIDDLYEDEDKEEDY